MQFVQPQASVTKSALSKWSADDLMALLRLCLHPTPTTQAAAPALLPSLQGDRSRAVATTPAASSSSAAATPSSGWPQQPSFHAPPLSGDQAAQQVLQALAGACASSASDPAAGMRLLADALQEYLHPAAQQPAHGSTAQQRVRVQAVQAAAMALRKCRAPLVSALGLERTAALLHACLPWAPLSSSDELGSLVQDLASALSEAVVSDGGRDQQGQLQAEAAGLAAGHATGTALGGLAALQAAACSLGLFLSQAAATDSLSGAPCQAQVVSSGSGHEPAQVRLREAVGTALQKLECAILPHVTSLPAPAVLQLMAAMAQVPRGKQHQGSSVSSGVSDSLPAGSGGAAATPLSAVSAWDATARSLATCSSSHAPQPTLPTPLQAAAAPLAAARLNVAQPTFAVLLEAAVQALSCASGAAGSTPGVSVSDLVLQMERHVPLSLMPAAAVTLAGEPQLLTQLSGEALLSLARQLVRYLATAKQQHVDTDGPTDPLMEEDRTADDTPSSSAGIGPNSRPGSADATVEGLLCAVLDEMSTPWRSAASHQPQGNSVSSNGSTNSVAAPDPQAVCPWQLLELLQLLSQHDQDGSASAGLSARVDAAVKDAASCILKLVADTATWQALAPVWPGMAAGAASQTGPAQMDLLQELMLGDTGRAWLHGGSTAPTAGSGAATQPQPPMQQSMHNAAAVSCCKQHG